MVILVDMDGVLCDFEANLQKKWKEAHPDIDLSSYDTRHKMHIEASDEQKKLVNDIVSAPNFYLDLAEISGGVQAIRQMRELGHEVFIVTSAGMNFPNAPSDKYRWVQRNIGPEWVEWLIITKSKYAVHGDILIDDKPKVYGSEKATWEHILYDQPYNRSITDKRRLDWSNWHEVLNI